MRHHKAYETDDSGDRNQRSHDNGADHKHPAPEIFTSTPMAAASSSPIIMRLKVPLFPCEADTARQHAHRGNPQGIPLSRRQASHLPVVYGRNALRTLGQKDEKARDGAHHCIDCRSGKKQRHGLNFSAASDLRHAVNTGKGHQSAAESHSRGLILSPEKRNRHQQRPGCSCRCSGGKLPRKYKVLRWGSVPAPAWQLHKSKGRRRSRHQRALLADGYSIRSDKRISPTDPPLFLFPGKRAGQPKSGKRCPYRWTRSPPI